MGRAVRRRPVRRAGRAEQVHPLRLGAGPLRPHRVAGAHHGAVSGRAAHRGATRRAARRPGQPRPRRRRRQLRPAGHRRGRACRAGAGPDRPGRTGPGRPTAGRALAQRPGGRAVSDVAARRGAPGRHRCARRGRCAGRAGRRTPERHHARQNPPAVRPADPAGTPSARARPPPAARPGPHRRLRQTRGGVPVRLGRLGRLVAGPGSRRDRRGPRFLGCRGQLRRRDRRPRLRRRGGVRVRHDRRRPVPAG
ncbi:Uncharacterised protein [Mycobacterium tuberculosis]|nr:Uncharacterised protein [Mycobacterium tuberculosis]